MGTEKKAEEIMHSNSNKEKKLHMVMNSENSGYDHETRPKNLWD